MILNLEFKDADGQRISMAYDVHPRSQAEAIPIPEGAVSVVLWLGTY